MYFNELIANGKIEEAFDEIINLTQASTKQNEVLLLRYQYGELQRQIRLQLINISDGIIQRSKIVDAILEIANSIGIQGYSTYSRKVRGLQRNHRIALLVGCNDYQFVGKLVNPLNDVYSLANSLNALDFDIDIVTNCGIDKLIDAINRFVAKASSYSERLFYYAGHAVQIDGINYIVPVDSMASSIDSIRNECYIISRISESLDCGDQNMNFYILDACRTNPFTRDITRGILLNGLAKVAAPSNSIVAFSTAPNSVALDGIGNNSLYTGELIKYIGTSNISITQMFQLVRRSVRRISNNLQTPWESTSLMQEFYFNKVSVR